MNATLNNEDLRVILARIEEKLDAQQTLCAERRGHVNARLEQIAESQRSQGERLGKLESAEEHRAGQLKVFGWIIAAICSIASVLGNLAVNYLAKGI